MGAVCHEPQANAIALRKCISAATLALLPFFLTWDSVLLLRLARHPLQAGKGIPACLVLGRHHKPASAALSLH